MLLLNKFCEDKLKRTEGEPSESLKFHAFMPQFASDTYIIYAGVLVAFVLFKAHLSWTFSSAV
jgi:hypothetical protein